MVIFCPVSRAQKDVDDVFRDCADFLVPFLADEPFCEFENFWMLDVFDFFATMIITL